MDSPAGEIVTPRRTTKAVPGGGSNTFFGLVELAGSATRGQLLLFLFATVCMSNMTGLLSLMQPYVMATIAHVPIARQGVVNANLNNLMLFAAIICSPIFGGLADNKGRKPMMLLGLIGQSSTLFFYPFATNELTLYGLRLALGVAIAAQAVSIGTLTIDYPTNQSRGRFIAIMLTIQSLTFAALVGLIGGRLPLMLANFGFPEIWATRLAFWIPAGMGLLAAVLVVTMFREPVRAAAPADASADASADGADDAPPKLGVVRALIETLKHARRDAAFRTVFLIGLVIRSDFVIVNTFLALWISNSAARNGVSAAAAAAHAGVLLTVIMLCQVVSALLVGYLADRLNRNRLMVALLLFAALAYAAPGMVENILGWPGFAVAVLLGCAEGASTTIGQTLLGHSAPKQLRGSSLSVFGLIGQIGAMAITFVGGFLYDRSGYAAPFLVVAGLNFAVMLFCVSPWGPVRLRRDASGALPAGPAPLAAGFEATRHAEH